MNILTIMAFAPWVRNIFIVTADQALDLSFIPPQFSSFLPRIVTVDHRDIIPPAYLPTFNSLVIEMYLYRIPQLSETWIYLNDDMYFAKPFDLSRLHKDSTLIVPAEIEKKLCTKVDDNKYHKSPNRYIVYNTVTLVYHLFPIKHCLSYANDPHYPIVQSKLLNQVTYNIFQAWYERQSLHKLRSKAHLYDAEAGYGGFQPLLLTQYIGAHLKLSKFSSNFSGLHAFLPNKAAEAFSQAKLDFVTMQDLYLAPSDNINKLCFAVTSKSCGLLAANNESTQSCTNHTAKLCNNKKQKL